MLTRVGLDWIEIEICILEMCIGIYIYIYRIVMSVG